MRRCPLEPMRLLAHSSSWKANNTRGSYEITPHGKDVLLVIGA